MSKVIQFTKTKQILCEYHNQTSHLQAITLLNNYPGFERVIFPGKKFTFKAVPEAFLEVRDFAPITSIYGSIVYCSELVISKTKLEQIAA